MSNEYENLFEIGNFKLICPKHPVGMETDTRVPLHRPLEVPFGFLLRRRRGEWRMANGE